MWIEKNFENSFLNIMNLDNYAIFVGESSSIIPKWWHETVILHMLKGAFKSLSVIGDLPFPSVDQKHFFSG